MPPIVQSNYWRLAVLIAAIGCSGCGGGSSDGSSTSHDEIAAFIEENPEYADQGKPKSDNTALGLER